jgi:hypothetical protein
MGKAARVAGNNGVGRSLDCAGDLEIILEIGAGHRLGRY